MAWLLAIFLIPFIGIVLFLLIGNIRLPKKRMATAARGRPDDRRTQRGPSISWPTTTPGRHGSIRRSRRTPADRPARDLRQPGDLIDDYQGSIDAMATDIATATRFVHVEFFIVAFDDDDAGLLRGDGGRRPRGVRVRLLMDHIASSKVPLHKATVEELDRIGVEWHYLLPVRPFKGKLQRPDLRNHRKIVVVDGVVGHTGSQNLIDRSYDSPKNLKRGLHVAGAGRPGHRPGRRELNAVFLSDWYSGDRRGARETRTTPRRRGPFDTSPEALDCQVVPSGPAYETENNLRQFLTLVNSAQERVIITSPYFVPDEAMMYAITSASCAGSTCSCSSPRSATRAVWHAQRSYYRRSCEAGVRIWLYPGRTSCTRSTCRSTTTSRSSARATWTSARSRSTSRSRCSCAGRRSSRTCARSRRVPRARPRAHARGVGARAGVGHVPRRHRAAHVGAAVALVEGARLRRLCWCAATCHAPSS